MKTMKRLLVWWLTLAMLLSMSPAASMAEIVSSSYTALTQNQTPLQIVDDKVAANLTDGSFVSYTSAEASAEAVPTGAQYSYTLRYRLSAAPYYMPEGGAESQPCYTTYQNTVLTITVPADVELIAVTSSSLSGVLERVDTTRYTYTISSVSSRQTQLGELKLRARMTNNATVPGGTTYEALGLELTADVTVAGNGETRTFTAPVLTNNTTSVINTADSAWGVSKSAISAVPTDADTVTATYTVEFGLKNGDAIRSAASDYNKPGVWSFTDFTLTDTLPMIVDAQDTQVSPTAFSMALLDQNGQPLPEKTVVGDPTQSLSITMHDFNTLQSTGDAGGSTEDGQTQSITLPAYSRYLVTATYPRASFKLPYERNHEQIDLANSVSASLTLTGGGSQTYNATGALHYEEITKPGFITVEEYLRLNGINYQYDVVYANIFAPHPVVELYLPEHFDTQSGAPKTNSNTGAPYDPVDTLTIDDVSQKSMPLKPGTYIAWQSEQPDDTVCVVPAAAAWQVTVGEDENKTIAFTNAFINSGLLRIRKVDEKGRKMPDVTFTLTPKNAEDGLQTYTCTTGADGAAHLMPKPGTYILSETAPEGYVAMDEREIVIESGKTVDLYTVPITNALNDAALTLNGYAVYFASSEGYADGQRTPIAQVADTDVTQFTYLLEWSTDASFQTDVHSETLNFADGASTLTRSHLPRTTEDGKNYYHYRLTQQSVGMETQYSLSTEVANWTYRNGDYHTVSFHNLLRSRLAFRKVAVEHDSAAHATTLRADGNKAFDLYHKDGEAYTRLETLTTDADGLAITTDVYPILLDADTPVQYALVEKDPGNYTPVYANQSVISIGDAAQVNAWTMLQLDKAKLTDLTDSSLAVKNFINQGQLQIIKTQNVPAAPRLVGAEFSVRDAETGEYVQSSDTTHFVTGEDGTVLVGGLQLGRSYIVKEEKAPEGYRLSTTNEQTVTVTAPAQLLEVTFANDRFPELFVSKRVWDTVQNKNVALGTGTRFTFYLYRKNGDVMEPACETPLTVSATNATATVATSLPVSLTDEAGKYQYYLLETAITDAASNADRSVEYIDGTIFQGNAQGCVVGGKFYYGPFTLTDNQQTRAEVLNARNDGRITLSTLDKRDPSKALTGATYTIAVITEDVRIIARLMDMGFEASDNGYELSVPMENSSSKSVGGLPVYDMQGAQLEYTVTQTAAPSDYLLPDPADITQKAVLAQQSGYKATLRFADAPLLALTALKLYYKQWEMETEHPLYYGLSGATLGLYLVDEEEKLARPGEPVATVTGATGEDGLVRFDGLDGTKRYFVAELAKPAGYELESEKMLPADYDELIGKRLGVETDAYVGYTFDMNTLSIAAGNHTATTAEALINVLPYVRFHFTKWSDDASTPIKLNRAKYQLRYCTQEVFAQYHGDLNAITENKQFETDSYAYESGSALTQDGSTNETGVFVTNPKQYGLVYWFVETEAPLGYYRNDDPVGPFAPEGVEYAAKHYTFNQTVEATQANTPISGGDGSGVYCYFRVEVNKELADLRTGTRIKNLPNVTFTLYLADELYRAQEELTHFTTGLDKQASNYAEVAGRGVSETLEFSALYGDDRYMPYITRTGEGTPEQPYEYSAKLVLVETAYPADSTPVQLSYPLLISSQNASGDGVRLVVDRTYVDHPIRNVQDNLVPIRFHKLGYQVETPEVTTSLQGVTIAVYADEAMTSEVALVETDEHGFGTVLLDPRTTYYYQEIRTCSHYEMDNPETPRSFTTGGYGAGEMTLTLKNPQLRELTVTKLDAQGNAEQGVSFTVTLPDGGAIVDGNGEPLPDTFVTNEVGQFTLELPFGTYTLRENATADGELTSAEKKNFVLVNQALPFTFDADKNALSVTVSNPGEGTLEITKRDDINKPVDGVTFDVSFKGFASLEEIQSTVMTQNKGFGLLPGKQTETAWTTGEVDGQSGRIVQAGLVPGWYRLVERPTAGYVIESESARTHILKVTARGIGQENDAALTKTIVNTRRGHLRLDKSFAGDLLFADPASVRFRIYRDAELTDLVLTQEVSIDAATRRGEALVQLDPGVYYVQEEAGDWYGEYALRGEACGLVSGAIKVKVAPDDTRVLPLTLSIVNKPALATVTGRKTDDEEPARPMEGVQFAIYYLDGDTRLYYHADTRLWTAELNGRMLVTTDAQGTFSFEKIKLPISRALNAADSQYYVEEVFAPVEYAMSAPVAITLTSESNAAALQSDVVNVAGLYIDLTQYGRKHEYAEETDTLGGVGYTLYIVDGAAATEVASATTAEGGLLCFGNLDKLKDGRQYAIAQTVTPQTHVEGSADVWLNGEQQQPISVICNGETLNVFVLTETKTLTDGALKVYNTPKGSLMVLKYNYLYPNDPLQVPYGARFALYRAGEAQPMREDLLVGTYLPDYPDTLSGGYTKDGVSELYLSDGESDTGIYLTSVHVQLLEPGDYVIKESTQALGFYETPHSTPDDPWHPEKNVTVDEDGGVQVAVIANIPQPQTPKLDIRKTVTGVNGVNDSALLVPSLQNGWQTVTYAISDFTSDRSKPIQLPMRWLMVEDVKLSFEDAQGQPTEAEHRVQSLVVGAACYMPTQLHPVPASEPIYAAVYGLKKQSGTVQATYLTTLDVTDDVPETGRKVVFDGDYQGMRVVYGVQPGSETLAGLREGFSADPISVSMSFRQEEHESVVPVLHIDNTADVELMYDIGQGEHSSGTAGSLVDVDVDPEDRLPHVAIEKTAVRTTGGMASDSGYALPGDNFTYTLTLRNLDYGEEAVGFTDPVLMDELPAELTFDVNKVSVGALPAGMRADAPVRNGQWLYVRFHGELPKGESISITVPAVVNTELPSQSATFANKGYVISTYMAHKNRNNPNGVSFADEYGTLPTTPVSGEIIGGSEQTYYALCSSVEHAIVKSTDLRILKSASADLSGSNVFIGSEGYALVSPGGDITYKLTISNGSSSATQTHLRVLDKLPAMYDTRVGNLSLERLSKWAVTLDSVVAPEGCTVYVTDQPEVAVDGSTNYVKAMEQDDHTGWSTSASSYNTAKAVLIDFGNMRLESGQSVEIILRGKAVDSSVIEAGNLYFTMANNDITVVAMAEGGPLNRIDSAPAKVCVMPTQLTLGNRVWIDKNGDGIQNVAQGENIDDSDKRFTMEPSFTQDGGLSLTLRTFLNSDSSYSTTTAQTNNGFYTFTDLHAARIYEGAAQPYDASGNIINDKLFGTRKYSYQLAVNQLPAGYLVTKAYARAGGNAAPNVDSDPTGELRLDDSNFRWDGSAFVTEKFYLPVNGSDYTFDIGLLRVRNLKLTKKGTDGRLVDGAMFSVYGPYTQDELEQGVVLTPEKRMDTLTTEGGVATLTSTESHYLNHYAGYVVVEKVQSDIPYEPFDLTAQGSAVKAASGAGYAPVTGPDVSRNNYFFLTPKAENDTAVTDEVTVTNTYRATGSLTVSGIKTLNGIAPEAGLFRFTMTSADDPYHPTAEATNLADGSFAFPQMNYVFASDAGKTYHYLISEENDGTEGVNYDKRQYTLTVNIQDMGDGQLRLERTLTCSDGQPCADIAFANGAVGALRISKRLEGNAADSQRDFNFTLTLLTPQGTPLTGELTATGRHSTLTLNEQGVVTFPLKGDEYVELTGLPTGARYTLTEADERADGYQTTLANAQGTVGLLTQPKLVEATNTRNAGALTVCKELRGNLAAEGDAFDFTLNFTAPAESGINVNRVYTCEGAQRTLEMTNGTAAFTLAAGESLTILDVPAGVSYAVTEAPKAHYEPVLTYSDAAQVITADMQAQPARVTATNSTYGRLEISKTVTGNAGESNRAFVMALTLSRADSLPVDGDYSCVITRADGAAKGTLHVSGGVAKVRYEGESGEYHDLALKGGETLTISGLLTGTSYAVTEEDSSEQGYLTRPESRTHSGQIAQADALYRAAFSNHRAWGAIMLKKDVAGNATDRVTDYRFTIELSHDKLPVALTYPCIGTGSLAETTSLIFANDAQTGKAVAEVMLKAGDTLEIQHIYAGASYTITEESYAAEGYTTSAERATGTLSEGTTQQALFTNTRNAGSLRVSKTLYGNYTEAERRFPIRVTLTGEGAVDVNRAYPVTGDATDESGAALTSAVFEGGESTLWLQGGHAFDIADIPTGTTYTVSEDAPDGYTAVVTYHSDEHRVTQGQSVVTVENQRFQYAPLTLSKQTSGNAPDYRTSFDFVLTLTRTDGLPLDGDYACTYQKERQSTSDVVTVTGGKARLTLQSGQSVTLESVLTGTSYAIAEDDYTAEGYAATDVQNNSQGVITADGVTVIYDNERYAGTLEVSKHLYGNHTEVDKDFRITVTLTAPTDNPALLLERTFPCTGAYVALSFTKAGDAQYACSFTLKGGQSVRIEDIPEGVQFSVQEDDYTADGYAAQTVITPQNALIERDTQGGATEATAEITNTRNRYGAITVSKHVSGAAADTARAFDFTLTLDQRDDLMPTNGDYEAVLTDANGKQTDTTITIKQGKARFALAHGETLRVEGILTGTKVHVEEDDASAEGYACQTENRRASVTINSIDSQNVLAFVNDRPSGTVRITKNVAGNAPDEKMPFGFTVTMANSVGVPVDGSYDCTRTSAATTTKETITVTDGSARVTLLPGESLDIEKVLKNTTVTVREDSYEAQGYAAAPQEASVTVTAEGELLRADFVNTRNVGELQVVTRLQGNGTDPNMPFHYTLTLTREDTAVIAGDYTYMLEDGTTGTLTVDETGSASFDLTGGRTLTLKGVLADTAYQIAQDNYGAQGYTTTAQTTEGTVPVAGARATFTNSRYVGNLTVRKAIEGNAAEPERDFHFIITATSPMGAPLTGTFAMTGDENARTVAFARGQATLALRGGESVTINGLLRGTRYTVAEVEANTENYTTVATSAEGLIAIGDNIASFVNSRELVQEYKSITVKKVWDDEDNKDGIRPATLTVYLYNERGVLANHQLSEENGWSCQFDNLPVYQLSGEPYTYRVTETALEGYFASVQQSLDDYALTNTHIPDPFMPIIPEDPSHELKTLIEYDVPLSGNTNMNEGDCFD